MRTLILAGALALVSAAPAAAHEGHCLAPPEPVLEAPGLRLVPVAQFDSPVHAVPDGDRLLVAERRGTVRVLRDGAVRRKPLIDLSRQIAPTLRTPPEVPNERGLQSIARSPDGKRLYAFYSGRGGDIRIDEFRLRDGRRLRGILTLEHSKTRIHYGGQLAFSPSGRLYASIGDRQDRDSAQRTKTPYGKVLRLDLRRPGRYTRVAMGLRNPFRFSFDGRRIVIVDVGEQAFEEVNAFRIGERPNFGWPVFEGTRREREDPLTRYFPPVLAYEHDGSWNAIAGGYVVRAAGAPLRGRYLYGDFCAGFVRSFVWSGGAVTDERDLSGDLGAIPSFTSFGQDAKGELYVVSREGAVSRIAAAPPPAP